MQEKKRILVVDDNQLTREAIADVLQEEGYDVTLAANGQEAVRLMASYQPNLVLTDLQMPGLDGMEVLAHVKNVYPTIPVMIFTAHTMIGAEREARRLGVQDYLNKPLNIDDMLARVARALSP